MKFNRAKKIEELLLNFHNMGQKVVSSGRFFRLEADITFSQWMALEVVIKNKKASINEISKALHISSSAATQLTNGLEKKGWVKRKVGMADKRFSEVGPSLKARRISSEMKRKKISHIKKLFSGLNNNELETFAMLINQKNHTFPCKL